MHFNWVFLLFLSNGVARKGVQWFGNAAKFPLFQECLTISSPTTALCPLCVACEDNIMEGSLPLCPV